MLLLCNTFVDSSEFHGRNASALAMLPLLRQSLDSLRSISQRKLLNSNPMYSVEFMVEAKLGEVSIIFSKHAFCCSFI